MFSKIKEFIYGHDALGISSDGVVTPEDVVLSTAVLLLEVAGRDEDYAPEEVKSIGASLQKHFNLSSEDTKEILKNANALRQEKEKIDSFVNAINQYFSSQQRRTLLGVCWNIILADGVIVKEEKQFATQIQYRLKLSDEDAEIARKQALQGEV